VSCACRLRTALTRILQPAFVLARLTPSADPRPLTSFYISILQPALEDMLWKLCMQKLKAFYKTKLEASEDQVYS